MFRPDKKETGRIKELKGRTHEEGLVVKVDFIELNDVAVLALHKDLDLHHGILQVVLRLLNISGFRRRHRPHEENVSWRIAKILRTSALLLERLQDFKGHFVRPTSRPVASTCTLTTRTHSFC